MKSDSLPNFLRCSYLMLLVAAALLSTPSLLQARKMTTSSEPYPGVRLQCAPGSSKGFTTRHNNVFVDASVPGLLVPAEAATSDGVFQLFTHGRPGQLFIEGHWRKPTDIVAWLMETGYLYGKSHLNIYGCEFARGETGRAAVRYIKDALGISVAASDNITGLDGDWDLEVGTARSTVQLPGYAYNLQSPACNCTEYLYLNDEGFGETHKFRIAPDGSLTEVPSTNGTFPFIDSDNLSVDFSSPHGLAQDNNGFIYIAKNITDNVNQIHRFNCAGELINADFIEAVPYGRTNFASKNGVLYEMDETDSRTGNSNGEALVRAWSLCDGSEIGTMRVGSGGWIDYRSWGFFNDETYWYLVEWNEAPDGTGDGCVYRGLLDKDLYTIPPTNSGTQIFCTDKWGAMGITSDDAGNFYIVTNQEPNGSSSTFTIQKFSPTGALLASTTTDSNEGPNTGMGEADYFGSRGIAYSATSGYIYVGNFENCVTVFDSDLVQISSLNIGNPTGGLPKGLSIAKECCPIDAHTIIDTTLCSAPVNTTIYLQDLINCDGTICEGVWYEDVSNTGLTYNSCDNSITIDAASACGTFTLASNGSNFNTQCGAFTITVNVKVENITAPVVAGDQTVCAGDDPAAFTIITPAFGSSAITYQWQSSTIDCTSGFTDIAGATAATYDPPALTETTYYRLISSVNDMTCQDGSCSDISNCLTVTVESVPVTISDPLDQCENGTDMSFTATPVPTAGTMGVFTTTAGAGFTDNGDGTATLDVSAAGAGTYQVTYTYTDENGCTASATTEVNIAALSNVYEICDDGGTAVQLTADAGLTSVTWYNSSNVAVGTGLILTVDPQLAPFSSDLMDGTEDYYYIATDGNGCPIQLCCPVTIVLNNVPVIAFTKVDDTDCQNPNTGSIDLTVTGGAGGYTYDWADLIGTNDPEDRTGLSAGNYTVTITDANGCMQTANITILTAECAAVGNYVFMDNNNNGIYEAGTDMPIENVWLELYQAGADPGVDAPLTTTSTNADGNYYFDNLNAGDYFIYIPASNFTLGQPLFRKENYPGADDTDTSDGDDNGVDIPVNGGIASNTFTLTPNTEPVGEDQTGYVGALDDDHVNATIDFVFRATSGTLSGHLYLDNNGNGIQDAGEPDLADVDVLITDANGNTQTISTDVNGNWAAIVPSGITTADIDETDPDYPIGATQTEGDDPTVITVVAGMSNDGGVDGFYPCVDLELWVYLEGSAIYSDGSETYALPMRTNLNDLRLLPGQTYNDFFFGTFYTPPGQPYHQTPWNYAGTEGTVFDSGGDVNNADAGYPATVTDWVLVSLRTDPDGTGGPLCQSAALLHEDGRIEFVGGFACCTLDLSQSYYVVVEHRNHLIVMSDAAIPVNAGKITYDFRNQQSYIDDPFGFGIFAGQKEILPGVFAMYGGNSNQIQSGSSDTDINFDDRTFWEAQNGTPARYRIGDHNLNGDTNFNDRTLWEFNNGLFTSVPRN